MPAEKESICVFPKDWSENFSERGGFYDLSDPPMKDAAKHGYLV